MKKLLFFILFLPILVQGQIITTIAGNGYGAGTGTGGYTGDNGSATAAELYYPTSIALDNLGNMYIADEQNRCIRKVNASGIITTIAGNGTIGCTGDNGPATDALLYSAFGVAIDKTGNILIADGSCGRIRKIDASGIITTIAGNGSGGYSGDGGPATAAAMSPLGITIDTAGNIIIADAGNSVIRRVNPLGIITTIAGNGAAGFTGDGGPATAAQLGTPYDVAVDTIGNIYIADASNNRIRKVSLNSIITTIAGQDTSGFNGDNRLATTAELDGPHGVKVDHEGNVYIADSYNSRIRKVNTSGVITTIAGGGIVGHLGDGGDPTLASLLGPNNVALDAVGNIYIADMANNRIRFISYDLAVPYLNSVVNNLTIWPNPTNNILNIISSQNVADISVSNLLGQTVYKHEYNTEQVEVNVSGLPEGIYVVQVTDAYGQRTAKKFVKQ